MLGHRWEGEGVRGWRQTRQGGRLRDLKRCRDGPGTPSGSSVHKHQLHDEDRVGGHERSSSRTEEPAREREDEKVKAIVGEKDVTQKRERAGHAPLGGGR